MRIRIPRRFYIDHRERDLPTPVDHGGGKSYVLVNCDDPALPELLDDAKYYAHPEMCSELWEGYRGLVLSARATVKAIEVGRK